MSRVIIGTSKPNEISVAFYDAPFVHFNIDGGRCEHPKDEDVTVTLTTSGFLELYRLMGFVLSQKQIKP